MDSVLVTWVGQKDLDGVSDDPKKAGTHGPIFSTVEARQYTHVYILHDYPKTLVNKYIKWFKPQVEPNIETTYKALSSPIDFAEIYTAANDLLLEVSAKHPGKKIELLISPGTPAMQAVWILLGKTKYDVTFIQSTKEQGVQVADIPFEIAAEFLPPSKSNISNLAAAEVAIDAAFENIITKDKHMNELKLQATVMAAQDVPVLIYGETGTGKELFARAIHNASSRKGKPFIPVNCGAFPPDLIDSALFGHVKGSFTGATSDKAGYFEAADGGTLFLDEFGELPLEAQVRLLRALQEQEIIPVGSTKNKKIDVRVISATNKDLLKEIAEGKFREDLFYRIAVGVIKLPPLRERSGDLAHLAEHLLQQINQDCQFEKHKKISTSAKKIILRHEWKGNVRELYSTLLRACLWSKSEKLTDKDIQSALFQVPTDKGNILERDMSEGVDISGILDEVESHYIRRALELSQGKKTKAAELLGIDNYQNLTPRMKKYGIEK